MPIMISIIGTGQIGTSIGLALGAHKDQFLRVGHDKNLQAANRAKAMGAVDKVDFNLPHAVTGAQIIILALPYDQIHATLQSIALERKEDAILMDTAPLKTEISGWAAELLPADRYYIGLTPVINPLYLSSTDSGVEAAHADLFKDGLMAVYLSPHLPAEAVQLAIDFSTLLGAEHMFIELNELDSMMAATHVLPQLLAAAYANSTIDTPGWKDARKLAGRPYAMLTAAMGDSPEVGSLPAQAMSSRESLLRLLDEYMENLDGLRQQLRAGDEDQLLGYLEHARQGHEKWLEERKAADWANREMGPSVELPSAKEVFTRFIRFGGGRKPKPPK
jgi:prephenate dehydrogenase